MWDSVYILIVHRKLIRLKAGAKIPAKTVISADGQALERGRIWLCGCGQKKNMSAVGHDARPAQVGRVDQTLVHFQKGLLA